GRLAAAQVVVVHAGQVVVDEAVGVQHLDGAGCGQGRRNVAAADAAELQHQHGPQALAARHEAVVHRLQQAGEGQALLTSEISRKRGLYHAQVLGAALVKAHSAPSSKGSSSGSPSGPLRSFTTFCSASSSSLVQAVMSAAPSSKSLSESASGASPRSSVRTTSP